MLAILHKAESLFPELLAKDDWHSLDVDYHDPRVERVWRQWDEYRINLHVIHPCKASASLFHPHPWPSAMRVLQGTYEMEVGFGSGTKAPPIACKMISKGDFAYEMIHPDGWHSVRPIDDVCWSVMISGTPWGRDIEEKPTKTLNALSAKRVEEILTYFRAKYGVK